MTPVSTQPAHQLLQRRDDVHDKASSGKKAQKGASSVFAAYGFGPLDTSKNKSDDKGEAQRLAGAKLNNPLTTGHSLPMLTSIQEVGNSTTAFAGALDAQAARLK